MRKLLLIILLLTLASFALYNNGISKLDIPPEQPTHFDDSKIIGLQKILPPAIYSRKLEELITQNKEEGLTDTELEELEEYLRELAKEYSGKTRQTINKAADELAAILPPQKSITEKATQVISIILSEFTLLCKEGLPVLKEMITAVLAFITDLIEKIF